MSRFTVISRPGTPPQGRWNQSVVEISGAILVVSLLFMAIVAKVLVLYLIGLTQTMEI